MVPELLAERVAQRYHGKDWAEPSAEGGEMLFAVGRYPSEYSLAVVLVLAPVVFGVLVGVAIWFLTDHTVPPRPPRKRRPNLDPGKN
jgi:hypothetical protein